MLYLVMGSIGAIIGWGTNYVAIWLLFRPWPPINIGPWKLQGLLPQRQPDIAVKIGQLIEGDLLATVDLSSLIADRSLYNNLSELLRNSIDAETEKLFPRFFPKSLHYRFSRYLHKRLDSKEERLLTVIIDNIKANVSQFHVSELIAERLKAFPLDELEKMVWELVGKELRYIEYAGGVLGAIAGVIQAIIISFAKGTLWPIK